ncbi:MAG TPA: hypothetical protein VLG50_04715 [Candidatus Saccharimonadales bacterium]|nr:hypothetical protein [Candidatus Saccharimonadales bacterium]
MHRIVNSFLIRTTNTSIIRQFSQTSKRLWPTMYTVAVNGKIQNDKGTQQRLMEGEDIFGIPDRNSSGHENYRSNQNSPGISYYAALAVWTCYCILLFR